MKITPAKRATKRRPGRAAVAASGVVGIIVRAPGPDVIFPRQGLHVVTGPAELWSTATHGCRQGDMVTAHLNSGRLGARRARERGKKGWRTIPGARWRTNATPGSLAQLRLAGSGPRGGRPR